MSNEYSSLVLCAEEANTARETYDDDRGLMSAEVTLRCAYGDRHLLVGDICGNLRPWPKGAAGVVPKAKSAAITADLSVGAFTAGSQLWIPYWALVTIRYSTKDTDVVTEEIEFASQFAKLDHKWFKWGPLDPYTGAGDALKDEESPAFLLYSMNLTRNVLFLDSVDDSRYDLVGFCNDAPYVSSILNRTFATETLVVAPPSVRYKKTSIGDVKYDITQKFAYQPQGWNRYFRTRTNSWEEIFLAGSSTPYKNYTPADLSGILA